ncbi:MAG: DUF4209 domain-containing protein [Candidatus Levybacteria bacterium]|nr:DUF4209 domain-containing protein [Candidatus Levybacteria bacterium]
MDHSHYISLLKKAQDSEESHSYFSAAIYYKDALEEAVKLQNSPYIKLCKNKLVEMNEKSLSGEEFKEVEVTYELSPKEQTSLKLFIESFLKIDNKQETLSRIGLHPYLMPKVKEIKTTAGNTMPVSYQFVTLASISEEGHSIKGGSVAADSWYMQMYDLYLKNIMSMSLSKIFYILINDNPFSTNMSYKDFETFISKFKFINKKRVKIILTGMKSYFEKDYVSALHILVPQFESLILDIAKNNKLDVVAVDRKVIATRPIILSENHLDSPDFKRIFSEDFCAQIKFVLFEPLGFRLRHKIAHGEITFNECNFQNTTLVLYLYLALLSRQNLSTNK